jgi:hypothetical protein
MLPHPYLHLPPGWERASRRRVGDDREALKEDGPGECLLPQRGTAPAVTVVIQPGTVHSVERALLDVRQSLSRRCAPPPRPGRAACCAARPVSVHDAAVA